MSLTRRDLFRQSAWLAMPAVFRGMLASGRGDPAGPARRQGHLSLDRRPPSSTGGHAHHHQRIDDAGGAGGDVEASSSVHLTS
jgi:hypothetical protein